MCIGYYHGIFGMQIFIASVLWLWIGMNNIWGLYRCRSLKLKRHLYTLLWWPKIVIIKLWYRLKNKIKPLTSGWCMFKAFSTMASLFVTSLNTSTFDPDLPIKWTIVFKASTSATNLGTSVFDSAAAVGSPPSVASLSSSAASLSSSAASLSSSVCT